MLSLIKIIVSLVISSLRKSQYIYIYIYIYIYMHNACMNSAYAILEASFAITCNSTSQQSY